MRFDRATKNSFSCTNVPSRISAKSSISHESKDRRTDDRRNPVYESDFTISGAFADLRVSPPDAQEIFFSRALVGPSKLAFPSEILFSPYCIPNPILERLPVYTRIGVKGGFTKFRTADERKSPSLQRDSLRRTFENRLEIKRRKMSDSKTSFISYETYKIYSI